jgi:hypothetical protein
MALLLRRPRLLLPGRGNTVSASSLISLIAPEVATQGPSAYTQRSGPSAAQVRAVHSYQTSARFTKVQASINDDYVSATAPVTMIDQAFSVQMRLYQVSTTDAKLAIKTGSSGRGLRARGGSLSCA